MGEACQQEELRVSDTPLEVERRLSDPIRLESGCKSSGKGENRRRENVSHRREEEYPQAGHMSVGARVERLTDPFHLRAVEYFRHRPTWSSKAAGDFWIEAAMAFFPEKGEVRRAEGPVFIRRLASGKSPKVASLTVYLAPGNPHPSNPHARRKNSGQSRWERSRKMTDDACVIGRLLNLAHGERNCTSKRNGRTAGTAP